MASFKITRAAGSASLTGLLRSIVYLTALAAWKHESGAWLVIASIPSNPHVLTVHWRASEHWGSDGLEFVAAFEEADDKTAWARALKSAETAWADGPGEGVLAKAERTKGRLTDKLRDGGTKGGLKSGKVRAEIADTVKTERAELIRAYPNLAHYDHPKYDPRLWTVAPIREGGAWIWNVRYKTKKAPAVFVNMIIPTDDKTKVEVHRSFYVGQNEDNGMTHEIVATFADDIDAAFAVIGRLLASDPATWLCGDFASYA